MGRTRFGVTLLLHFAPPLGLYFHKISEGVRELYYFRANNTPREVDISPFQIDVMSEEFQKAAEKVKSLTARPSNEELLDLYSYFKQVTVGDVNTDRPGMFYMKDRAKWDRWESRKGMSKEDAEKAYIDLVNGLLEKYPS